MESVSPPPVASPLMGTFSGLSSRSRSSTKLDDVTSLTSFNPFAEEDDNDQSSYTLTSIFSLVKNSLAPLSTAVIPNNTPTPNTPNIAEQKRPPTNAQSSQSSVSTKLSERERPASLARMASTVAPPLVSLTPVQGEAPSFHVDYERSPSRSGLFNTPVWEAPDGGLFGTAIPGFPIPDDARSIKTSAGSLHRSASVSKVIRRIRGEGLSKDYWMDDENAKECYDCKSVFTTWRRRHHCRICGQIFCARCASNIISASRFGHDGMVRVCNLCLDKLGKAEDDEDDRRSVISSTISFAGHQFGSDNLNLAHHPQSPFAAAQLFGRSEEPYNLYSIAETRRLRSQSDGDIQSPITQLREGADGVWEPVKEYPAPFRRELSDDKDSVMSNPFDDDGSPIPPGAKTPFELPKLSIVDGQTQTSFVQFPMGSPERNQDSPRPQSRMRTRFDSFGDPSTPFIRSRVQSRLDSIVTGEPGWRTRRESTAYAHELNLSSMHHLRVMLRQMLVREQIPNFREWEETLLKLALKIARELTFTAFPNRQGEEMDVRRYVKIKKIPGGLPQDSEYVDGCVITKNVAHKQMSRSQRNPRIMLVTFPVEFHRVEGVYMHFGQIFRQEKEYLGNLASRIAALRPHIVLVEKSVSRLALDALAEHNVAVARCVKPSVIQTVARMTGGDIFSSIDKLAQEPRLGHCGRYRIQTFDHPLIPGKRKTYMRFEGCPPEMGCTLVLRGGDIETLKKVKKVTRFLTFIVRNLKLETHLWKDSVITLPSFNDEATPGIGTSEMPLSPSIIVPNIILTPFAVLAEEHTDLPDEDAEQLRLTRRIEQSIEPYRKTFISVSATLRFPPPYPLRRMKELNDELIEAKRQWEDEVIRREESAHAIATAALTPMPVVDNRPALPPSDPNDINAQIEALPMMLSNTPEVTTSPFIPDEADGYFSSNIGSTVIPTIPNPVSSPPPFKLKTTADIALESRLHQVKCKHEEQKRIWEWYLRKNADDFVVEKYQCISLVQYTIPLVEFGLRRACFSPEIKYVTFYGENDCTLGQYIESAVAQTLRDFLDPTAICTAKGCDEPRARHCKVYVHNETRLFVAVEQWDGQIIGRLHHSPSPDLITTWSACRLCGMATPFIPVSQEMMCYSFAKFLELHFNPADVKIVEGAGCQHNIYQHHVRYFAVRGMTVRFQADPITLHEIVYPPMRVQVRPEVQLELKNADYEQLIARNIAWYSALIDDLKLISIDAATGDQETDAKLLVEINSLIKRADNERQEIEDLINRIYTESAPTDTLALNQVHAIRQDKIIAWQQDFDRLPKPKPLTTIDKGSKRTSAFGSVRSIWPRKNDFPYPLDSHVPSSSVSEAEENLTGTNKGEPFTSSASEAEASESEACNDVIEKPVIPSPPLAPPDSEIKPGSGAKQMEQSDVESDSTIGRNKDEPLEPSLDAQAIDAPSDDPPTPYVPLRRSRLPRPMQQQQQAQQTVAELVKKYQDHLPPQTIQDLARTALPPSAFPSRGIISESEQEYPTTSTIQPRNVLRTKTRHQVPTKKPSVSDFESSYAANIAPRYLTHGRKPGHQRSRIPGPVEPTLESTASSRRPSPEKRPSGSKSKGGRPVSPNSSPILYPASTRASRMRSVSRTSAKDKPSSRSTSTVGSRAPTFRRPPGTPGGKVSNIAKHFERLGRDAERMNRRYAVIRGKRARPVASAKLRVEVLESIKDAINDDTDLSDTSSQADDEGENDEHASPPVPSDSKATPAEVTKTQPEVPELQVEQPTPALSQIPLPEVSDAPAQIAEIRPETQPATNESNESTQSVPAHPGPISLPSSPFLGSFRGNQSTATTPPADIDMPFGPERGSILKAISGGISVWLNQNPRHPEMDDPLNDPEHIFRDSSMIVRTDEPTSIIALALNSPQYREMLLKSRAEKRTVREATILGSGEAFMPDDHSIAGSTSTWGVVDVDAADVADPTADMKVASSKLPWAISFESGGLTISCTILYPEQFDALRRTYDCDKAMVESLARCVKWNANGGKSGSAFLKTRDDRFIAKEISRPELQSMESFAPAYFEYMSSAVSANRPTLLAKVFGCFKIVFKQTSPDKGTNRSKSTQMNLLVMENLFYDRRFTKIYDLKGSTRNRHVEATGRENEVLLDDNLIQTAHLAPFYLREHSKRILRGALYNDSKFLAGINVMDYSLVVGFDSQRNELVVGIVDYIRTYTWDKRLENLVKESAFLGTAAKGEPTIITPKLYRQRFLTAMERYFPLVPDRWMKMKDAGEEDSKTASETW